MKIAGNKNRDLLLMALPGIFLFIIFKYLPMFGVVLAFKQFNVSKGIFGSPWHGLENFKFLFRSTDAWLITRNTIGYNIIFIILGIIIPVFIAIVLSEIRGRRVAKLYQTIFIMPHFLSWVVVSFIAFAFLNADKGFINNLLGNFGIDPVSWYTEAKPWPGILVFIQAWKTSGYTSIIYLAAIAGIDSEYYEAAMIDGAGKLAQAFRITIPFLIPMISILTILAIGRIFYADFGLFFQVPRNSGPLYPVTQVIDTYVYIGLRNWGNIGMAAATNLYQSFVGFILVLSSNLIIRKFSSENALF